MGGSACISPMRAPSAIRASSVRLRFAEGSAVATERAGAGGATGGAAGGATGGVTGGGTGGVMSGATGAHPPEMLGPAGRALRRPPLPLARRAGAAAAISHSRDSICASSRPWARAVMAGSHPLRSARAAARVSAAAEIERRSGRPLPNSEKTWRCSPPASWPWSRVKRTWVVGSQV